jgi:hypothetical protein
MIGYLQIFAAVCFSVLAFGAFVLGADRGNKIKRVNATVVHFFVMFMTLWYYLGVWGNFVVVQMDRDDGSFDIPLLHYITATTIMITFTALISYKIKQTSLNVVWYTFFCLFVNLSMILSVILYTKSDRDVWTVVSIVFTVVLIVNTIKNSEEEDVGNHKFVKTVVVLVVSYIVVYLCVTLMGPLHQDMIPYDAQNSILTVADLLVSMLCALPIIHYGWAIDHKAVVSCRPGFISFRATKVLRKKLTGFHNLPEKDYLEPFITKELIDFVNRMHTFR